MHFLASAACASSKKILFDAIRVMRRVVKIGFDSFENKMTKLACGYITLTLFHL